MGEILLCYNSNESYFSVVLLIISPVVLFIVLYKVVVTFQCVNEILWCYHSNESYSKQYFPVVLFILLYKVVLTFETVEEILWCDHSNESY